MEYYLDFWECTASLHTLILIACVKKNSHNDYVTCSWYSSDFRLFFFFPFFCKVSIMNLTMTEFLILEIKLVGAATGYSN